MEIKIFEGDYLDGRKAGLGILPSRILHYIDDNKIDESIILGALNKLMVVELHNAGMAKLLFRMGEYEDSFIADIGQATDLIREYKIMNISENVNRRGDKQQLVLIVDMARIERVFLENDNGIVWNDTYHDYGFDRFVIPVDTILAMKILDNPAQHKLVRFSKYRHENVLFDGKSRRVYFYKAEYQLNKGFRKLELTASKKGDVDGEEVHHDFLANIINAYDVYLTSHNLRVFNNYEMIIDTRLDLIEETPLTTTYIGNYNNGQKFRLVKAGKMAEQIMKAKDELPIITLASMHPSGYAVTFMLKSKGNHFKVPLDPNKTNVYYKRKRLNGQQLALLFLALSKNLFPKPTTTNRELLYEEHNDATCTLFFKDEYYKKLVAAITDAYIGGKFGQSNNEKEWNNLKYSMDDAESAENVDMSTLKVYLV